MNGSTENPEATFARVLAVLQAGDAAQALTLCQQALDKWPQQAYFWNLLATLYAGQQDPRAGAAFERAVTLLPAEASFRRNLADYLRQQGRLDTALGHYHRLLQQNEDTGLRKLVSRICLNDNRLTDARAFMAPLNERPDAEVLQLQAKLALLEDDWPSASRLYAQALWRQRGQPLNLGGAPPSEPPMPEELLPHKLRHDLMQADYLVERGLLAAGHPYRRMLQDLWQRHLAGEPLPAWQGRNLYISPLPAESGAVLQKRADTAELEAAYARDQVIVVDHLLRPEVRQRLYDYCLVSTIWHDAEKHDGYVGSMMYDGLVGELLFQIAHELRDALPGIFRGLPLRYMWAFKYDSQRRGIRLHGDPAAVNVNFWITPDEANLDPASGGLIVYPDKAPADWSFAEYNLSNRTEEMYAFLAERNSQPLRVPYRCNRAVIFCSDLFHATDFFMFRPEYVHRRINLTMLYGRRGE